MCHDLQNETHTHNRKMIKIRGILGVLQSRINKIDPLHLSRLAAGYGYGYLITKQFH
jgi:hypothetical protein